MKIGKHKVVSLVYELKLVDSEGELLQKVNKNRPFVYLFGVGGLLPIFEKNLMGKKRGDKFEFSVIAEEGYGPIDQEAIITLKKDIFQIDGVIDEEMLEIGKIIPMRNDQNHPINGIVVEVSEDKVIMDFNHPLAGKDLYFSGEILDVRDASEEELSHGHAHNSDINQ